MRKRRSFSKSKSRRNFKGSSGVHKKNFSGPMRGGIRF